LREKQKAHCVWSGCVFVYRMKPGVRKRSVDVSHPTSPGFHRRISKGAYEEVELRSNLRKASFDTLSMGSPKSPKSPLISMQNALHKDENDHVEPHFLSSDIIRDVVIGLSDGLTVPFALAAGLAAFDDSNIVVIAGMAEMAAGAISMGLGGYLAGNLEIEHYDAERLREQFEVETVPEREEEEIVEIFEPFGLSKRDIIPLLTALKKDPEKWVDFMMKFELGLERPSKYQTWISALTIGTSYLVTFTFNILDRRASSLNSLHDHYVCKSCIILFSCFHSHCSFHFWICQG
jgi:hypothetical protein